MWLKAFERVRIESDYTDNTGRARHREFSFTPKDGVSEPLESEPEATGDLTTAVYLENFNKNYSSRASKTARAIANNLLEHCLWYFVRPGGAPDIRIKDDEGYTLLEEVYEEYMLASAARSSLTLKNEEFELTHMKLKAGIDKQPFIAWCAAGRLVEEENIQGKIPGLFGKLRDDNGEFVYACYVTSPFLDSHVRPDRISFDSAGSKDALFADSEVSFDQVRLGVLSSVAEHLGPLLSQNQEASMRRVQQFVERKSPRYRPILNRVGTDKLNVSPDISDRDLELLLHKQFVEFEGTLLAEGQELMNFGIGETPEQYQRRLQDYLGKADDLKKSDLASYVFHRKVVLDILQKTVSRSADNKYSKEEIIHELIIPMRKTSNEITADNANLWLIDERLAFHNFLASDKTLKSYPITESTSTKEPDIAALNVFDEPLLVADGDKLPLASITVVEIKRPMRDDAQSGEDGNAIEQALGYLEKVRNGEARTQKGRPIPESRSIPGYCYVLCDVTPSVQKQCRVLNLKVTADKMGYFGYNDNYNAYIEVISFDRLVNAAVERNRAFFDKLGLPA